MAFKKGDIPWNKGLSIHRQSDEERRKIQRNMNNICPHKLKSTDDWEWEL